MEKRNNVIEDKKHMNYNKTLMGRKCTNWKVNLLMDNLLASVLVLLLK